MSTYMRITSLVRRRAPILDPDKAAAPGFPLECAALRRLQQRDDGGVIVGDGVDGIDAVVGALRHVLVALVAGEETPAGVGVMVGRLAVHEADRLSIDGDAIAGDATAVMGDEAL